MPAPTWRSPRGGHGGHGSARTGGGAGGAAGEHGSGRGGIAKAESNGGGSERANAVTGVGVEVERDDRGRGRATAHVRAGAGLEAAIRAEARAVAREEASAHLNRQAKWNAGLRVRGSEAAALLEVFRAAWRTGGSARANALFELCFGGRNERPVSQEVLALLASLEQRAAAHAWLRGHARGYAFGHFKTHTKWSGHGKPGGQQAVSGGKPGEHEGGQPGGGKPGEHEGGQPGGGKPGEHEGGQPGGGKPGEHEGGQPGGGKPGEHEGGQPGGGKPGEHGGGQPQGNANVQPQSGGDTNGNGPGTGQLPLASTPVIAPAETSPQGQVAPAEDQSAPEAGTQFVAFSENSSNADTASGTESDEVTSGALASTGLDLPLLVTLGSAALAGGLLLRRRIADRG